MAEGLLQDLPRDLPTFLERFGSDEACRTYLVRARWPEDFRCSGCGHDQAYSHKKRLIEECTAALRLPAIHLVFGLAKRWLLGTHHGAVSAKHLQAYLDEYVFRFNRRTAKSIAHRFARLIAVLTQPTTYRAISHRTA